MSKKLLKENSVVFDKKGELDTEIVKHIIVYGTLRQHGERRGSSANIKQVGKEYVTDPGVFNHALAAGLNAIKEILGNEDEVLIGIKHVQIKALMNVKDLSKGHPHKIVPGKETIQKIEGQPIEILCIRIKGDKKKKAMEKMLEAFDEIELDYKRQRIPLIRVLGQGLLQEVRNIKTEIYLKKGVKIEYPKLPTTIAKINVRELIKIPFAYINDQKDVMSKKDYFIIKLTKERGLYKR